MTERQYVAHETTDGIAHVRLTRPDKLNALTLQTLDELVATARELRRDRSLRAVVLSGEGASFCAGLDFGSALKSPAGIAKAFVPLPWRGTNTFQEAAWAWRRLPVPVIAAVEGTATAAACSWRSQPTSGSRPRTRSGRCSRPAGG